MRFHRFECGKSPYIRWSGPKINVARLCGAKRQRGRPLNSVVRQHVKRSVILWAAVPALGYLAVWLTVTSIALYQHNFFGLMLLGKITVPSSMIFDSIAQTIADPDSASFVGFGDFLVLGMLQYGAVGLVIGLFVQAIAKGKRDA